MKMGNVSEAKIRLSQLLDLAASGEEVIIARAGRPMAKLIPYQVNRQSRKPVGIDLADARQGANRQHQGPLWSSELSVDRDRCTVPAGP